MAFECKTLWSGSSGSGYLISFATSRRYVSAIAVGAGAAFFVKPIAPGSELTAAPSDPTPANGTVCDGYAYVSEGSTIEFGSSEEQAAPRFGGIESIKQLAIFCKADGGSLSVVAL